MGRTPQEGWHSLLFPKGYDKEINKWLQERSDNGDCLSSMLCSCAFLMGSPRLPVVSASASPDDMCVSASLGLFPTHTHDEEAHLGNPLSPTLISTLAHTCSLKAAERS